MSKPGGIQVGSDKWAFWTASVWISS